MAEKNGLKCPLCGGEILLTGSEKNGTCSLCQNEWFFCGKKNAAKIAFLNKINALRQIGEFDAALAIYKKIPADYKDDAEICWGAVLCTYGVVYVKTGNGEYVPTVSQPKKESIFYNKNYRDAILYSDIEQKGFYRYQAMLIDSLCEQALHYGSASSFEGNPAPLSSEQSVQDIDLSVLGSVDPNLKADKVARELNILVRERHQFLKIREKALTTVENDRTALKKINDRHKLLENEKLKVDRIIADPYFYKKKQKKKIDGFIWIRILTTVLLLLFASAILKRLGIPMKIRTPLTTLTIIIGLILIWYKQIIPPRLSRLRKKQLIDIEREKHLREQIIQCEMQITNLTRKLEKSKQDLAAIESKLNECEWFIAEYVKTYDFAEKQLEKINASLATKIATAVSESITNGINTVKNTFKK